MEKQTTCGRVWQGLRGTLAEITSDYLCSLCFETYKEPQVTKCGHSFCRKCLVDRLEKQPKCPQCTLPLTANEVFANVLLEKLVNDYKSGLAVHTATTTTTTTTTVTTTMTTMTTTSTTSASEEMQKLLVKSHSLSDAKFALEALKQRKCSLQKYTNYERNALLFEFLRRLKNEHESNRRRLRSECADLKTCLKLVQNELNDLRAEMKLRPMNLHADGKDMKASLDSQLEVRRKLMSESVAKLRRCYLNARMERDDYGPDCDDSTRLLAFQRDFQKFCHYRAFQRVATLNYTTDLFSPTHLVSSIECNSDEQLVAVAGTAKQIKIYHYDSVMQSSVDIHYPCVKLESLTKLSCLAWSPNSPDTLVASDYNGKVVVWDVETKTMHRVYREHRARSWSVDFNKVDPRIFASGSDDGRIKLWSIFENRSLMTIVSKARVNVRAVRFNPTSSFHIAFGATNNCIYYHDVRKILTPVHTFRGHEQPISHLKFFNSREFVSAGSDSRLKIWRIPESSCVRTFYDHENYQNSVGLAVNDDYIVCGSEDNSLYMYYRQFEDHMFSYSFEPESNLLSNAASGDDDVVDDTDTGEFVSAIYWHKQSDSVIAANSRGMVHVLRLKRSDEYDALDE